VVGVVAAALQLHEIPSRSELVGIALLLGALALNALPGAARESPQERQYVSERVR
jgi:drug/metabolite transporter (DMT)-like permease